ncbi:pectate lyase family protein [Streptomyces stackebrandtii]|uniref:peptidoglycan-binding protein n=1 Tax=Streptomyces stackebrandtii TaxID=3051177 RepID=UPI0028DC9C9E|nr:peptidoglycan-binding protein [Streptomyces sp. DSM 40976]
MSARRTKKQTPDRKGKGRHSRTMSAGRITAACAVAALATTAVVWVQSDEQAAQATQSGTAKAPSLALVNGKLSYTPDASKNRIPDFSSAGYKGGGVPLPDAAVAGRVDARGSGDDTPRIQAALDSAAKLKPSAAGVRGAVLLGPGTFRVTASLKLADGVVLRGSGTDLGNGGTLLKATGAPGSLIAIGGDGDYTRTGQRVSIAGDVPVGATEVTLQDASSFKAGERIVVQRPTTQEWINAIGMNKIPGGESWKPNSGILAVRTVVAVSGKTLTLDAPITTAIEKKYGGGTAWHYTLDGQVTHAGVENLAADAKEFTLHPDYGRPEDGKNKDAGAFASRLVTIGAARDVWVKDVKLTRFGSGFYVDDNASRVTIERAADLDMAVPDGLAPPPAFMVGGQQVLVRDTTVTGDRVHAWTTQAFAAGPNVFTRSTATSVTGHGQVDAGPHMRWASGTLYDQLTINSTDGAFIAANAWDGGTGHGWQGANNMFWNTKAAKYAILTPPTANNWAYGITGKQVDGKHDHELPTPPALGTIVSPGKPVAPAGLYEQQLSERHRP